MKKGISFFLVVLCYLVVPGFTWADSNLSLHAE